MISRLAMAAVAAFTLAATPALAVGKRSDVSWGRAGISFEQYRADALECGNRAYGVHVEVPNYNAAVAGWGVASLPSSVWIGLNPGRVYVYSSQLADSYRNFVRWHTVDQLQAAVDSCLIGKGYQRFRLTSAQMRTLRRLQQNSPERHQFLHSLGSDGSVLAAQAVAERPPARRSMRNRGNMPTGENLL